MVRLNGWVDRAHRARITVTADIAAPVEGVCALAAEDDFPEGVDPVFFVVRHSLAHLVESVDGSQ